jgi:glycosyltransferase involved in cell wall biosynthesis
MHGIGGYESGVRRLVLEQARTWSRLRPDVDFGLFVRCEAGAERAWEQEENVVAVRSSRWGMPGRLIAREVLSVQLARWKPDLIYLRHSTISPSVVALAAATPTVLGGDLDDLDELRVQSRLRYRYMLLTRRWLLRHVRRIVVVTHEIARHRSIAGAGVPVSVLPNSIDLDEYAALPSPENAQPHLVFIGAPGLPWAGVDKVVRMARLFPNWQFEIIGTAADQLPSAPENVTAHGELTRDHYRPILQRADVAIGPLALHRKSLHEASALKVAEYLAHGIPVILGCPEAAFPDGAPFLLQLPNVEDNVERSTDRIGEFVAAWRGRRVPREDISPISTDIVEGERLRLLLAEARPAAERI